MTKLARLIGQMEGFGILGAVPTRDNNPGDLRHAPNASHEGEGSDDIGIEPTVEDGWSDLERQLQLDADRGYTMRQLVYTYAPPDENDSERYLYFLCNGLGVTADTPVAEALKFA